MTPAQLAALIEAEQPGAIVAAEPATAADWLALASMRIG
jgi:hypothetical protein